MAELQWCTTMCFASKTEADSGVQAWVGFRDWEMQWGRRRRRMCVCVCVWKEREWRKASGACSMLPFACNSTYQQYRSKFSFFSPNFHNGGTLYTKGMPRWGGLRFLKATWLFTREWNGMDTHALHAHRNGPLLLEECHIGYLKGISPKRQWHPRTLCGSKWSSFTKGMSHREPEWLTPHAAWFFT